MKRVSLSKITKINNKVTMISNIVTAIIAAGYTYATISAQGEEKTILLILGIPILFILLGIVYVLINNINNFYMQKYYNQRLSDTKELDKMFSEFDITNTDDIKSLKNDMAEIISQYQR